MFCTGLSVFDVTSCTNDTPSLQSFFKTWIHDCSTDIEHMQLLLPTSSSSSSSGADGNIIIIKCDVWERMLDLSSLPITFSKNLVSVCSMQ